MLEGEEVEGDDVGNVDLLVFGAFVSIWNVSTLIGGGR